MNLRKILANRKEDIKSVKPQVDDPNLDAELNIQLNVTPEQLNEIQKYLKAINKLKNEKSPNLAVTKEKFMHFIKDIFIKDILRDLIRFTQTKRTFQLQPVLGFHHTQTRPTFHAQPVSAERDLTKDELRKLLDADEPTARAFIDEKRNPNNSKVWITLDEYINFSYLSVYDKLDHAQFQHLGNKKQYGEVYNKFDELTEYLVFYKLVQKFPPKKLFYTPLQQNSVLVAYQPDVRYVQPLSTSEEIVTYPAEVLPMASGTIVER